jgi:hypothetical protein
MSKSAPQISVLTANRLGDGVVVFLDGDGDWTERISAAAVARTPEEVRALEARGAHDAARNLVLDFYLVEVREAADGLTPVRMRERVRVAGPSILADVPGYVSPSPRASPTPPRAPSARGEGRGLPSAQAEGEGQPLAPASAFVAAPHPSPLPVKNGERGSRAAATEAA